MNPRAATNDLLPFQGSPFGQLGYFSELKTIMTVNRKTYNSTAVRITATAPVTFFLRRRFFRSQKPPHGECGIRTHVPVRTNGFQDRLVMTASITLLIRDSLRIPYCAKVLLNALLQRNANCNKSEKRCQSVFRAPLNTPKRPSDPPESSA